ncbi:MAG: hypothetical protein ACJ8DZ_05440 [Allosphingosinicella sp.]
MRLLLPFLLLAAASPSQAAPSAEGDVAIAGNVAGLCILGPPSRAAIDLGQLAATSGSRTGRIAALPAQTITLPGSFCNFAGTSVSIQAEALVGNDAGTLQPGFARAVNYTSTVGVWAATAPLVTTAAAADGGSPAASGSGGAHPEPKITDLVLTLSNFTVPSDAILVSGLYAGRVTITLGPAVGGQTPGD